MSHCVTVTPLTAELVRVGKCAVTRTAALVVISIEKELRANRGSNPGHLAVSNSRKRALYPLSYTRQEVAASGSRARVCSATTSCSNH